VPEFDKERDLEQMLRYTEPLQSETFVMNVMQDVQRAQRTRKLVLAVFGLIGAVFGVLGAFMLTDSITRVFSDLPALGTMQAVLAITAVAAFYAWFMNDGLGLSS
jgi:membrane associated rhomboid family serine protease